MKSVKSFRSTRSFRSKKNLGNKTKRSSGRYRSRRNPTKTTGVKTTSSLRTPGFLLNKIRQHSGLSVSSDPSERHRAKIRQSMLNWTRPEYTKEFEPSEGKGLESTKVEETELPPRMPLPNREKNYDRDSFDEDSILSDCSSDEEIVPELNEENIPPKIVMRRDRFDTESDDGDRSKSRSASRRFSRASKTSKASRGRDIWMEFDDEDAIEKGAKVLRKLKAMPEKKIRRLEEKAFIENQVKKYKDAEIGVQEDRAAPELQTETKAKALKRLKPGDPGFDDCKKIVLRLHNNKTPHHTIRTILENMGVDSGTRHARD